jgi:type I restriction enzyme S subunit
MRAMKDSGIEWIGQIPQEWSTVKVKFTGNYQSGNSITASAIKERGEFPVYGGNGLRGYTDHFTHNGSHILIGRQGALCGNVHLVNGMFWASEHAVVGKIADNYNIRYIYYLLDVFNLNRLSTTAAQPGISVEQIVNVIIPKPPKKVFSSTLQIFLTQNVPKLMH